MGGVVVCGAGAAGLGAAASLRRVGLDAVILERSDRVGASWRSRYPALRLNTPGWMSTMPGYRASVRRYGEFPSRDDWIRYLEPRLASLDLARAWGLVQAALAASSPLEVLDRVRQVGILAVDLRFL